MSEPESEGKRRYTRSISQYNSYVKCPEQFRLERMEKVPARPAAWLAHGIAFHHAMDVWEQSERKLRDWEILRIFVDEYNRLIDETKEKWPDLKLWLPSGRYTAPTDIPRRRELGQVHCLTYMQYAEGAPWKVWRLPNDELATEVGFRLMLGDVELVGFVDAVIQWDNGAITPRDLKSGKEPVSPLQLGVYGLALWKLFGIDCRFGDFFSGKTGHVSDPIPLDRYTEDYLTSIFTDVDRGINEKRFPPNPGDHCRICPVKGSCREMGSYEPLSRP